MAAFGVEGEGERFVELIGEEVPEPYRRLLVHDQHMTVTLEAYHKAPVLLKVHDVRQAGGSYGRKITLHTRADGPAVMLGLMRIHFQYAPQIREEVQAERTPLGHVLIRHDLLRRIRPGPYYRIGGGSPLLGIAVQSPPELYGRCATIQVNGGPAVELVEIITAV